MDRNEVKPVCRKHMKKARPKSNHLDRTSVIRKEFIVWQKLRAQEFIVGQKLRAQNFS